MARDNLFKSGTCWLKADFHMHTVSDKQFQYAGEHFATDYINKLIEKNIRISVITNHNKFRLDEYRELKDKGKMNNIWVLPGVELSVDDGANGIHVLIVFDPKTWIQEPDNYIERFLNAAFENVSNFENADQRCIFNLTALLNKLSEYQAQGRDSFVILAHVDQTNGFFGGLNGGKISQIASNELFRRFVLGFQKSRTRDNISNFKQWAGCEAPVLVEGSDCKSIADIGKVDGAGREQVSYVKMGEFNFNALKYALSDHKHRVANSLPDNQNQYIKSISFEGGLLDGERIIFSPELNCFIGIRGSGKSSIIEMLRYALGLSLTSSSADNQYKSSLVEYALGSGGKVKVELIGEHGKYYRIEKIYNQKEVIYDEDGNIVPGDVVAVFNTPVYFGQKDLSYKNDGFQSDLLRRLIGNSLDDIQRQIESKKIEVKNLLLEKQQVQNTDALLKETESAINNLQVKLNYFSEKGVEEKLRSQTEFDSDEQTLTRIKNNISTFREAVNGIISDYKVFFSAAHSGSEQNKSTFEKANALIVELRAEYLKMEAIVKSVDAILDRFACVQNEFGQRKNAMQEDFAKIKRDLNSETINPDMFLSLNKQLNTSRMKLVQIQEMQKRSAQLETTLLTKLVELNELWHQNYLQLKQEADKINNQGGPIQIDVTYKGNRSKFLDTIKGYFRGTAIRETTYQGLVDKYQDFIEIYRDRSNLNQTISENSIGIFNARFDEHISELLTYKVPNSVVINYKGKPLDKHSLGQRASALILFLLAQKDTNVLVIDQPEDDLDNQTIYDEIIKKLIELKGSTQFVFATHNANIPVLGDSEQVMACDFDDQSRINVTTGSIDNNNIQQMIVKIMEGGEEAFNKRRDIYNIWSINK